VHPKAMLFPLSSLSSSVCLSLSPRSFPSPSGYQSFLLSVGINAGLRGCGWQTVRKVHPHAMLRDPLSLISLLSRSCSLSRSLSPSLSLSRPLCLSLWGFGGEGALFLPTVFSLFLSLCLSL